MLSEQDLINARRLLNEGLRDISRLRRMVYKYGLQIDIEAQIKTIRKEVKIALSSFVSP